MDWKKATVILTTAVLIVEGLRNLTRYLSGDSNSEKMIESEWELDEEESEDLEEE